MLPITRLSADLNYLAIIHPSGMDTTVHGFDPLSFCHGHTKTHGDIARNMVTAHAHGIGIYHMLFHEDRHTGRAAAQIDAGRAQFLFVFHQCRNAGHV